MNLNNTITLLMKSIKGRSHHIPTALFLLTGKVKHLIPFCVPVEEISCAYKKKKQ